MPDGGQLTIESAIEVLGDEIAGAGGPIAAGRYVTLTVSDTGTGIPPEVREHLFEPFFTTKELGKGTGLGLATVYGIVKQSGGEIVVSGEAGRGATFRVFLPCVEEPALGEPSELA
jgi:signal transduction histidine kinase